MDSYIYIWAPLLGGAFLALGALVLTITPAARKLAFIWFWVAVVIITTVPVTFCVTTDHSWRWRFIAAGVSGALLGLLLCGVKHAIDNGKTDEMSSET